MRKTVLAALSAVVVFGAGLAGFAAHAEDFPPKTAGSKEAAVKEAASQRLAVFAAWARPTPGTVKNGAVYLEIKAGTDTADKLLSASGAVADNIEIHNHINDNGIMQMRRVDAVEIGEGASTKFVPGGYHIMLLGLKQPLKLGESFKLKLTFEKAGAIDVDVVVRANTTTPAKGSHTH
jgi:periplasmic copper chaperone A